MMVRASKRLMSSHDKPIARHVELWSKECLVFRTVAPGRGWLAELRDVVRCQLQDLAGQMAVGEPKFIQNREVIRLCDRDQVAGEMRTLTGKHGSPGLLRPSLVTRPCHTRWKAAC